MNRFRNILFVADRSKGELAALGKILEMAEVSSAKVTVIDALAMFPDRFFIPEAGMDLLALHQKMVDERHAELEDLVTVARGKRKVQTTVLVKEGIDYIEVIREVFVGKHDMVAKASDNNIALSGALFGTLDMHLLRKCPCPVFVIKPRRKISHSKILAAVDLETTGKKHSLDRQIVELAAMMAGFEEGSLDVLHAWHLPYEKKMRDEEKVRKIKVVDLVLRDLRERNRRAMEMLTSEWAGLEPRVHLVKGEPHQVLPRFVRENGIDLVVMGTVARSGIAGFFTGNTAEKILYALTCSVLAVKPPGFKSPVK